ncbi:MAG: Gfo/Idh/MocA family oxidoreductase [Chloroflexi bacterium]|nr:Gfo/Idh/MocA family oxidoreductase [Chloroflexota bacterium]
MMTKKMRIAIVGCGDIAGFTAMFARLNRNIVMTACCDVSRERAEAFSRRHGIAQVFTDYAKMLANAPLDAVYLAVPHNLHFEMMQLAIAAGRHILVEKPFTRLQAEGIEIVQMAENAGVKVAVNYQYRYDAGCFRLARAVQSGQIGEVRHARINIPWHREPNYFEMSTWHKSMAQAGGGTLITQGSHFLDVTLWACGSHPAHAIGMTAQRVFKSVEVEDLAMGILELENGALIELCSSMATASEQATSIEIYGSKGTAIYTDHPWPRVRFIGIRVKAEAVPILGLHALQRSIEGFRRWVDGGNPHLVTGRESLPVLAAVEAIYRSARSGKREPVEAGKISI